MTQQTIGFIGLGAMGEGQSRKLLEAGFKVQGFDIDGARVAALAEAGGPR